MSADEYRDCIRAFGLTPIKRSYEGATLHQDKDGNIYRIVDPDDLSDQERRDVLDKLRQDLGFNN